MEEIYFRGFHGRRYWCTDKVKLKPYFEQYTNSLSAINLPKRKTKTEMDILNHFLPEADELSLQDMNDLVEVTNVAQLTTLFDQDLVKKSLRVDEIGQKNYEKEETSEESAEDLNTSQSSSTCTSRVKKYKNRINHKKSNRLRREILVDPSEKSGQKDLNLREDFVVSFRIHDPFIHEVGDNSRPGRCLQEIAVLNSQTLTDLRDKIICETDFQDIRGDVSDRPEAPGTKRARDIYFSGMFYLDNTFYVDRRHWSNEDYSEPIKKWAAQKGIVVGATVSMEHMKIENLEIRFGYPYVYMHQGCCEHLIIINDARLLTPKDSLYSSDYPLMKKISQHTMIYCMLCSRLPAKWIVKGCDRLAHCPTYECKSCFKSFHYINGKKVGRFQAYQYWQKGTIL